MDGWMINGWMTMTDRCEVRDGELVKLQDLRDWAFGLHIRKCSSLYEAS